MLMSRIAGSLRLSLDVICEVTVWAGFSILRVFLSLPLARVGLMGESRQPRLGSHVTGIASCF